jgi:hypothetical protein
MAFLLHNLHNFFYIIYILPFFMHPHWCILLLIINQYRHAHNLLYYTVLLFTHYDMFSPIIWSSSSRTTHLRIISIVRHKSLQSYISDYTLLLFVCDYDMDWRVHGWMDKKENVIDKLLLYCTNTHLTQATVEEERKQK